MKKTADLLDPTSPNKRKMEKWVSGLREKYDPSKIIDTMPEEYAEKMEDLRSKDDEIRDMVAGLKDSRSLETILKEAKSNFSEREYVLCFRSLAEFHGELQEIKEKLESISFDISKSHYQMMTPEDMEYHLEYFESLPERFKKKTSAINNESIIVTAGLLDWIASNFRSDRANALRYWEKIYPQQSLALKKDTKSLLNYSEKLLNNLLTSLRQMKGFRQKRKAEQYVKVANNFIKHFNNYDSSFQKFHDTHIVKFLNQYKEILKSTEKSQQSQEELAENINQESNDSTSIARPSVEEVDSKSITPSIHKPKDLVPSQIIGLLRTMNYELDPDYVISNYNLSKGKFPNKKNIGAANEIPCPLCGGNGSSYRSSTDPEEIVSGALACRLCVGTGFVDGTKIRPPKSNASSSQDDDEPPLTQRSPDTSKSGNQQFIALLESLSNESPIILKSVIIKHAKNLLNKDRKTALSLLDIANRIQ